MNTSVIFVSRAIGHHNVSIVPSSNLPEDLQEAKVALHLLALVVLLVGHSVDFEAAQKDAFAQLQEKVESGQDVEDIVTSMLS